jgi:hypothetical protein
VRITILTPTVNHCQLKSYMVTRIYPVIDWSWPGVPLARSLRRGSLAVIMTNNPSTAQDPVNVTAPTPVPASCPCRLPSETLLDYVLRWLAVRE